MTRRASPVPPRPVPSGDDKDASVRWLAAAAAAAASELSGSRKPRRMLRPAGQQVLAESFGACALAAVSTPQDPAQSCITGLLLQQLITAPAYDCFCVKPQLTLNVHACAGHAVLLATGWVVYMAQA